jgi:hypothetical protein
MKISESRRLRGEKKARARQDHQDQQNSRHEKKFCEFVDAIAKGEPGNLDFTRLDLVLRQAGKTTDDLQAAVEERKKELAD